MKSNNNLQGAITIRRAGASDAPAIAAVTDAAYAKWIPVIGRKPLPMTVDYAVAVTEHRIDLAELNGDIAALIEMIIDSDHMMIENLAVLPAHQGNGLGKLLLNHAETVAKSRKLPTVRLLTNAKFQSNIDFYLRHMFSVDSTEAFKGGHIIHMSKSIGPT